MRIAYICLCHADPEFIARAAQALQYGDDGFFIHVDAKVDSTPFINATKGLKNVYFVNNRIENYWGGFHAIIATMRTLQLALQTDSYDRFVLLQGQDYPLVSPAEIHRYFSMHYDTEFCKANNVSISKNRRDYMSCCGFWYFDVPGSMHFAKVIKAILHRFNTLGIKYRPASFKNNHEKWDIYKGWAQFALTRNCVEYILDVFTHNNQYNKYMRHRFPPDEIYIHTIIHNSPFKEKLSQDIILNRCRVKTMLNLTYFEYPVYVTVFTSKNDYQALKDTKCLFVRKVNSSSAELLDEIDLHINNGCAGAHLK